MGVACDLGALRSVGGVVLLWRRDRLPTPVVHPVFAGRLLRAAFLSPDSALRLWGAHVEKIPAEEAARAQAIMARDREWAQEDPQKRWVLAGGDWNFNVPGERSVPIASPQLAHFGGAHLESSDSAWQAELTHWLEFKQNEKTHFPVRYKTLTRIDRWYAVLPSWRVVQLQAHGEIWRVPEALNEAGLSDHSPVLLWLAAKPPQNRENLLVPGFVAKSNLSESAQTHMSEQLG